MDSVYEFAWLTTQQIVVTSDKDGQKIIGFGSGFFFFYRDKLFFVTADHVSHLNDYEEGIRTGRDDYVWVMNNIISSTELSSLLTPIGGFYYFDKYDLMDKLSLQIPDMKDITFAIIPNSFKKPFLTRELQIEEQVIVPAGREKVVICSQCVADLKDSDYCLIEGCVQWNIVDGIKLHSCNVIHQELRFADYDSDGNYILKYPAPIEYKYWEGLSGAPVFNDNNRLIGMIIKVNEHKDTVIVVPIKEIIALMDYSIKYEKSIDKS